MRDGFASHGEVSHGELPAADQEASAQAGRPVLSAGREPRAVVVLVNLIAQSMTNA